ncbi:MAG: glycosyltransferase [Deltaproteobacteria bacterium]|nr:glycosyltransferase [Deltaproteobacteria bacterium]
MKPKIKILYIITSSGIGGAEKILYYTATGLDYNKYDISVCSLKNKGEIARALEKQGIEVYCLHMEGRERFLGWLSSIIALIRLFPYLIRIRPTIIHSFLFRANILARIAGYLTGVPIVISSVRVMGGEKKYFHYVEMITSFMVDHYVTVSESVKRYIIDKSKISAEKISVIYNGVNIKSQDDSHKQNVRMPFKIEDEDRILMTVGRLHEQKGHYYLVQAVSRVQKEFPKVKLLVTGEGEEENNLKKLVKSLDLMNEVIFAGLSSDMERILPMAELFILPSLWEGLPNALLEAMAAGKPVVATKVGGIPEIVVHGETGMLIPPGDTDALTAAILDLLQNRLKAKDMGEAGRIRAGKRFSIYKMIEKTENLYQELLKEKQLI